ncbi:FHA domain-containing protein [bacterium]|nr:FHA domain-containing protein [bacterium]
MEKNSAIVSGGILSLIGSASVALAGWWLFVGDSVVRSLAETPVALFLLGIPYMLPEGVFDLNDLTRLPSAPPFGAELVFVVGLFMLYVSMQLVTGAPSARFVAAYIHVVIALLVLAILYMVIISPIPWPAVGYKYGTWAGIIVLTLLHIGLAQQLFQNADDNRARNWSPFGKAKPCNKCGRKKDSTDCCPVHDYLVKLPYLQHKVEGGLDYRVPRKIYKNEAAIIGRDDKVDILLDPAAIQEFEVISGRHATLTYRASDDNYFIEDVGSTHGTSVNGQSIKGRGKVPITPGTEILLATVPFVFEVREVSYDDAI